MTDLSLLFAAISAAIALAPAPAATPAGPLAHAPRAPEASFASEAAKWPPTLYACTVLSPKDGAAKFCSFQRGGVQTIYTSEVLGHSPLTPERALRSAEFDQGIMVGFATGKDHGYRDGPTLNRQHLLDGCLPAVVTGWDGRDEEAGLRYEETSFVRELGARPGAGKGDDNAAAMLALKVSNTSRGKQAARVRLIINASSNGQPRGYPALVYRADLKPGDRPGTAVNAKGQTRLVWHAPPGARTTVALQGDAPEIVEFAPDYPEGKVRPGAQSEPPFTRYAKALAPLESHAAHKAFDGCWPTFWRPESELSRGPVGLGLIFSKPRLMRSVTVTWESTARMPPADGYRIEGFDGRSWRRIDGQINGKSPEELKNHPEIVTEIGVGWLINFDKVEQLQGFRVMIDRVLTPGERPCVSAIEYSATLDTASKPEDALWMSSDRDFIANHVDFELSLAPGASQTIYVSVPYVPCSPAQSRWLEAADFHHELTQVAAFWRSEMAKGAQLELPEAYPVKVWNANLHHMMCTSERNPRTAQTITLTSIGWYEGVWASLSAMEIIALDERGYHREAAAYLKPFIDWQGTMAPPGEFKTQKGFLASNDAHTWVRWASNHGFLLWAMANHYRMSGDRAWLRANMSAILKAVDWIQTERAQTKKLTRDGKKPPEWGLLPPGSTGDGAPNCYSFMGDAVTHRALDQVAAALEEAKHPRAREVRMAADEYRACILRGVRYAEEHTPRYRLQSSGREIPFIAIDVHNVWKINTGVGAPNVNFHNWWLDVGPLHLVDLGALDAKDRLTGYLLQAAEDRWMTGNVSKDEPYYCPQRTAYLGRDDPEAFVQMYYTLLVEGMDRQTFVTGESHHGQQNLPFCDAEQSRTQRMMLVRETPAGLEYAAGTPRAWLEDGKSIRFTNACTYYGTTSLAIRSRIKRGVIEATVRTPDRLKTPMRLRLRAPGAARIKKVTVNGRALSAHSIDGEWVRLPEGAGKTLKIIASYR